MRSCHPSRSASPTARFLLGCALAAVFAGGCDLAAVVASGIEENRRTKATAAYEGIEGRSFAVIVSVDPAAEAEIPGIGYQIQTRVTSMLAEHAGASGYVPAADVRRFQLENPGWPAMRRTELADRLGGVERLVLIEVYDFRLREPGNRYLWEGVASGTVGVVEADGSLPEETIFQNPVRVGFPDEMGYGQDDFGATVVSSALIKRFSDRAGWLFYDHIEPAGIEY